MTTSGRLFCSVKGPERSRSTLFDKAEEDGPPPFLRRMSFWCCGWCGFDWVVLAGEVWSGDNVGGWWVVGFFDFDAEDVARTEHIAGEEDERLVGGEADVGLFAIVVMGHVD